MFGIASSLQFAANICQIVTTLMPKTANENSANGRLLKVFLIVSLVLNLLLGLRVWNEAHIPDLTISRYARLDDAYFVKTGIDDRFVIEHAGRRYITKCVETLSWLGGTLAQPRSMGDGCTYMAARVGQSIGSDLIRHEGDKLLFLPWTGEDTTQTADVLIITRDEAVK